MSSGIALGGVLLGVLAAVLFAIDLATRPPCQSGYVRLVDLEPVGPFLALAFAAIAGVLYWRSRRGTRLMLLMTLGIVVLSCAAFLMIGAVASLVHHHGAQYDWNCWTF